MTSSNGNIFRVTGPLCGKFTGPGEIPAQRPVTRSFDVFFDLGLNKRLSKQPWGWWFKTPSWSLWRQCNASSSKRSPMVWTKSWLNLQYNKQLGRQFLSIRLILKERPLMLSLYVWRLVCLHTFYLVISDKTRAFCIFFHNKTTHAYFKVCSLASKRRQVVIFSKPWNIACKSLTIPR